MFLIESGKTEVDLVNWSMGRTFKALGWGFSIATPLDSCLCFELTSPRLINAKGLTGRLLQLEPIVRFKFREIRNVLASNRLVTSLAPAENLLDGQPVIHVTVHDVAEQVAARRDGDITRVITPVTNDALQIESLWL